MVLLQEHALNTFRASSWLQSYRFQPTKPGALAQQNNLGLSQRPYQATSDDKADPASMPMTPVKMQRSLESHGCDVAQFAMWLKAKVSFLGKTTDYGQALADFTHLEPAVEPCFSAFQLSHDGAKYGIQVTAPAGSLIQASVDH